MTVALFINSEKNIKGEKWKNSSSAKSVPKLCLANVPASKRVENFLCVLILSGQNAS